jgi:hypothetical protein
MNRAAEFPTDAAGRQTRRPTHPPAVTACAVVYRPRHTIVKDGD